ncbi:unnamed protein product [Rhizoctonia solani]|uniref:Uncharacterized protein n=1 Tax=Rhizoctonia solani TaxID=456999 RepID=A0A8H3D2N2_9AGAM|nr:unnamed protein product [Rhizoctonia solani]
MVRRRWGHMALLSDVSVHSKIVEAISALLLTGVLLSSFGAALSLLSARWFDLLKDDDVTVLEHRWECAQSRCAQPRGSSAESLEKTQYSEDAEDGRDKPEWNWRDYLVAKAIGSTLHIVFCGFATFVVGMVLYTWVAHSLITAIANTIIAIMGTFLILCMHLDFSFKGALQHMSFKRIRI